MRHVLAVTDLSPQAEPALCLAACVARDTGAALHVVHAMGLIGLTLREAFEPLSAGLIPRALAALEEQVRRAVPPEAGPASCVLDYRDLPRAIAGRRDQDALDLLVVGDRRAELGPESRLSVAAELGPFAAAPILVPSKNASWPPTRIQWSSPTMDVAEMVTWLGRLAPSATVVERGDRHLLRVDGSALGGPAFVVTRSVDRGAAWRGPGFDGASILLLPESGHGQEESGGEERATCRAAAPAAIEAGAATSWRIP